MSNKAIKQIREIMSNEMVKNHFKEVLKENAQIFMTSVIELVRNDSYLSTCEPKSVISSALTLAALKLPLNKSLGFCYIVPFKGIAQPQIGYKGLIQLAQRTKEYRCINADVVYEGELVSLDKITGEINLSGFKTSEKVIGYFAHFSTIYGFSKTIYWSKEKVEKHAKRFSKSFYGKGTPWQTDFDEMAKKTVLKHLISHYGPMTIEAGTILARIEEPDMVEPMYEIRDHHNPLESIVEEKLDKEVETVQEDAQVVQEDVKKEKEIVATSNKKSSRTLDEIINESPFKIDIDDEGINLVKLMKEVSNG